MKKNLLILLLVGLIGLVIYSCGTTHKITNPDVTDSAGIAFGTTETFDVVTWNIENYPKHDPETTNLLKTLLPSLKADCIAIQEVDNNTRFIALVNSIPGWSYKISDSGDTQTAIIYNTSTIIVDSSATIFHNMSNPFPRPPLLVKLTWQGQSIILISMHLKAYGNDNIDTSDPNDEEMRRKYACELMDQYITDNFANQKVIVVGDMNDQIQEPASYNVFTAFLDKPLSYKFADMSIAQHLTAQNCSYFGSMSHLDHILITNELFDAFADAGSYVKTIQMENYIRPGGWSVYDTDISDHRPVGARFSFSE